MRVAPPFTTPRRSAERKLEAEEKSTRLLDEIVKLGGGHVYKQAA